MAEINNDELLRKQVHDIVRAIPRGKVNSYGGVGAACTPPISGYICGRFLGQVDSDVPWWRVVGKDGALPINKRNPNLAIQQREQLEEEGVVFTSEGKVAPECFVHAPAPGGQGSLLD